MTELSARQVAAAAERLLDRALTHPPERISLGYGHQNWLLTAESQRFLIKIAPAGSDVRKASYASQALRRAAETGAPVPREMIFDPACSLLDDRIVRILEYVPGDHPGPALQDETAIEPFFFSCGAAVATLHTARCPAFASRIGGEPSFPTWAAYLEYRIPQIVERCHGVGVFTEQELLIMFDRALAVAREVDPVVRPRLTHRDLYLDNLLINDDGRLAAIIDFDLAEAWDPAADFVKPRSQIFPYYRGAEEAFRAGYADAAGELPPALDQRIRVAEVIELSNHVINASRSGSLEYAAANRRRLDEVLPADW